MGNEQKVIVHLNENIRTSSSLFAEGERRRAGKETCHANSIFYGTSGRGRTSVHALEDEHRLDLGVPDRAHQRHQARVPQVVQRADVAPQLGQAPPRPRLARDPRVERHVEPAVGGRGGG